jgi:hypothetical protein
MKFNPVLAAISVVIAALLGYAFYETYPANQATETLRNVGAGSTFAAFAIGLVGTFAVGAPSGRVKALISTASMLYLFAVGALVPVVSWLATGSAAFVITFGILSLVYATVIYGLVYSEQ